MKYSLTYKQDGEPIATTIKNGKNDKTIYLSKNSDDKDYLTVNEPKSIQLIPNTTKERGVYYICGMAGSGKSYFCNRLIEQYHKLYKKRSIYLFSLIDDDPSITSKFVKRVKLDKKFIETSFELSDFQDSMIVFDDVDTIRSKGIKDKLFHILDTLLQCGRHKNCSIVYISHIVCNGNATKMILNESNYITIFPRTLGARSIRYLLQEYIGMDKSQIKKVKTLDTRAVTIMKMYPSVILYDQGAYLIDSEFSES